MSNSVDTRIVRMRFDNEDFKKKAVDTIKTLTQLDQSIQLRKLNKSLSGMGKTIDVMGDTLSHSLQTLPDKFKGVLGVITTGIDNLVGSVKNKLSFIPDFITNAVFNKGKNRALNIEQAKFVLKGLGKTWEDYKDVFNEAVTGTKYGLDQAARAGSQLMSSGYTDQKKLLKALKGIANVASMTNTDYDQIAHHFTAIASQGRVMGAQLSDLSRAGVNAKAALKDYLNTENRAWNKRHKDRKKKKTNYTESDISDLVSKKKISADTFFNAMDKMYEGAAANANETFEGSLDNLAAAFARIGADLWTSLLENAKNVFNALRPIVDMIHKAIKPALDTINAIEKEVFDNFVSGASGATKSGSMIVWLLNEMSEPFIDILGYMKPLAKYLFDFTRIERGMSVFANTLEVIGRLVKPAVLAFNTVFSGTGASIDNVTKKMNTFLISLNSLLKKKNTKVFWTIHDIFARIANSIKITFRSISKTVNAFSKGFVSAFDTSSIEDLGNTLDDVSKKILDFSKSLEPTEDRLNKIKVIGKGVGDALGIIFDVILAIIKGLTGSDALTETNDTLLDLTSNIANVISEYRKYLKDSGTLEKITKKVGKVIDWLSENAVKPLSKSLKKATDGIKDWWKEKFGDTSVIDVVNKKLSDFKDKIDSSKKSLSDTFVEITGKTPKEAFDNLIEFFKDLPDEISNFWMAVTGKDLKTWFSDLGKSIKDFSKDIGNGIKEFFSSFKSDDTEGVERVTNVVQSLASIFKDNEIEGAKSDGTNFFSKVTEKIKEISEEHPIDDEKVMKAFDSFIDSLAHIIKKIISLFDVEEMLDKALSIFKKLKPVLDMLLENIRTAANIATALVTAISVLEFAKAGNTIADSVAAFTSTLTKKQVGNGFQQAIDGLKEIMVAMGSLIKWLAIMLAVTSIMDKDQIFQAAMLITLTAGICALLVGLALTVAQKMAPMDEKKIEGIFSSISKIIKAFGLTILMISSSLYIISKVGDVGKASDIAFLIGLLTAYIAGIVLLCSKVASSIGDVNKIIGVLGTMSLLMISFGASMLLMSIAISSISSVKVDTISKFVSMLNWFGVILGGMAVVAGIIASTGPMVAGLSMGVLAVITGFAIGLAYAMKIMSEAIVEISKVNMDDVEKNVTQMAIIMRSLGESLSASQGFGLLVMALGIYVVSKAIDALSKSLIMFIPLLKSITKLMEKPINTDVFKSNMSSMADSIDSKAVAGIAKKFIDAIPEIMASLMEAIAKSIVIVLPTIISILDTIGTVILEFIQSTVLKVSNFLTVMIPILSSLLTTVIDSVFDVLIKINSRMSEWLISLFEVIRNTFEPGITLLFDIMVEFFARLWAFMIDQTPMFIEWLTNLIMSLLKMVKTLVPEIIDTVFVILTAFFEKLWPFLIDQVSGLFSLLDVIFNGLIPLVGDLLMNLIDLIFNVLETFFLDLWDFLDSQIEPFGDFITHVLEYLDDHVDDWVKDIVGILYDILIGGINGVSESLPKLGEALYNLLTSIIDTVSNLLNAEKAKDFKSHVKKLVDSIIGFFKELFGINDVTGASTFIDMGVNLMLGLVKGLSKKFGEAKEEIRKTASGVLSIFKTVFEIKSPSRATRTMGKYLMEGLALGIGDDSDMVYDSAETVGEKALSSLKDAFLKIPEILDSNMDVNPTITPVLDLSEMENGLSLLNSMFNADQAYTISAKEQYKNDADDLASDSENQNGTSGNVYFTQNNYSPKSLSRKEIYRDTKNMISTRGKGLVT